MKNKPFNPWAFPHHGSLTQGGMTLRDYFAGQALAGFCVSPVEDAAITQWKFDVIARAADAAADAMLAERAK
jgi:hypothetical protein